LLQEGFKVEGIEPSKDMLEICQQKAEKFNLKANIYPQEIQNLNLSKKYKTIYMPLYVFQHIVNRQDAFTALKKIYEHLQENGQLLISIFMPNSFQDIDEWQLRAQNLQKNEKLILYETTRFDKLEQIQTKNLKFEIYKKHQPDIQALSKDETHFCEIKFRIYSRYELQMMLEQTGFKNIKIFGDYTFEQANKDSNDFIFVAKK